jgi:NTE family protein
MLNKHLGLALSGGGIKSYAQIGAYKHLQDLDIRFDAFAGTSMGSIIATLLAAEIDIYVIEKDLLSLERSIIDNKLINPNHAQFFPLITSSVTGLIDPKPFVERLQAILDPYRLEKLSDIRKPLVIVAVDLISGKMVYFTNRKAWFKPRSEYIVIDNATLLEAIQASCAFPMVFETMTYQGLQLVDGGVLMNIPVDPLKIMGINHVISITMDNLAHFKGSKKVTDIATRIIDLMATESTRSSILKSDFNINAYDKNIGIFSFGKGEAAIALGEEKTQESIEALLKAKLKMKRFFV